MELGGEGLPLPLAAERPMPGGIPPSVVLEPWCIDAGGVMPRFWSGTVGEYGLSLPPAMFWYRVMGDQSLLSAVETGDSATFRPGGFMVMFHGAGRKSENLEAQLEECVSWGPESVQRYRDVHSDKRRA